MASVEQQRNALTSMEHSEWYTDRNYLYRVRSLFGGEITLDPASSSLANKIVKAKHYYTYFDNGLEQSWYGNVFVNPPYGDFDNPRKPVSPLWAQKGMFEFLFGKHDVNNMIMLFNAKVGYKWFNELLDNKYTTVILHRDRMGFINARRLIKEHIETTKPSRQPQATIYFGSLVQEFKSIFGDLGWVI